MAAVAGGPCNSLADLIGTVFLFFDSGLVRTRLHEGIALSRKLCESLSDTNLEDRSDTFNVMSFRRKDVLTLLFTDELNVLSNLQ